MDAFPPAPYRIVAISIVVAAAAVTVAALVAIAVMLGWIGSHATRPGSAAAAPASRSATGITAGAALSPGETVVAPAEAPASNAARPAANAKPEPSTPVYRHDEETGKPPAHAKSSSTQRKPPTRAARESGAEGVCENCGTVSGTFAYPDAFAVSVRFEDGASRTFRFPSRPPFRVGDKVFDEGGKLVHAR